MDVLVKYFSVYRDAVNLAEEIVTLEEDQRLETLLRLLMAEHPGLRAFADEIICSVNKERVSGDRELAESDEVALFPPVSGG